MIIYSPTMKDLEPSTKVTDDSLLEDQEYEKLPIIGHVLSSTKNNTPR